MSEENALGVITFQEFEQLCASDGHPLYTGYIGKARQHIIEYFYHALLLKVYPKELYPWEAEGESQLAKLPRKEWHRLYAEALGELIEKKTR